MENLKYLNYQELNKYADRLQDHTYTCKCGHRVVIPNNKLKVPCNWCYRNVYKNKKDEFKDRMENMLNARKNK